MKGFLLLHREAMDYPWSKHEAEHYQDHEKSYGLVIISPATSGNLKILLGQTDNRWGFSKGHRNDGETPQQAAIRETYEEWGIMVKPEQLIPGLSFTLEQDMHYTPARHEKHIKKILKRQAAGETHERPYWNKPGHIKKIVTFWVAQIPEHTPEELAEIFANRHVIPDDYEVLQKIAWVPMAEAALLMETCGSRHLTVLRQMLSSILVYKNSKTDTRRDDDAKDPYTDTGSPRMKNNPHPCTEGCG